MFVSFGRRLRGLSGMRVGFRMKGSTGCLLVGIYGFMNFFIYLLWYTMLGVFWLIYGLCYLCYLLIKGIVKLCKKKSQETQATWIQLCLELDANLELFGFIRPHICFT